MARILVVTWDGGGNVPPALGIAAELTRRGHRVRVLGHPQQRAAVAEAGLEFVAYAHARPWSSSDPAPGLRMLVKYVAMFTDPGPGEDLRAELERESADLVLADCMSLGALRAAQRAGVPTATLVHTFHRYMTHGWSRSPIGAIAALRGMRPTRLWNAADRVLVATDRELDPAGGGRLPSNVCHTGVVQPRPRPADRSGRPLVLVSLSTIYYEGQAELLQTILDGLTGLPVRVVVCTGDAVDPSGLRPPPGAEVHRRADHAELLPMASLVIGHGGHATTMRALTHGVPMIMLPLHSQLDHRMIGEAVAQAGAARVLPKTASAQQIRVAVHELLDNGPHRAAACRIGVRLREHDGATKAAAEIDSVLATAPTRRATTGRNRR